MRKDEYTGLEKAIEEQCEINIFCNDKEVRCVDIINKSKSSDMRLQGYGEGVSLYEAISRATENYLNRTTFEEPYKGRPLTGREKLIEQYMVRDGARIVIKNNPNRKVIANISSPLSAELETTGKLSVKSALSQLEEDLALINKQMVSMNLENDEMEKGKSK